LSQQSAAATVPLTRNTRISLAFDRRDRLVWNTGRFSRVCRSRRSRLCLVFVGGERSQRFGLLALRDVGEV
jgi:hypothetical protein